MDYAEELQRITEEISVCDKCDLHFSRKNGVPGEGPINADIVFIGEGPGFHENEQGRPFVGAAGRFLDELLAKIGLKREDVYITNVVKCRPPGNREPRPEEVEMCASHYLDRQLQLINPKVIITLGRYSLGRFIHNAKISDVHGQAMRVKGRLIVPMYHPAAALHQASLRPIVEQDFAKLPELISQTAGIPEYNDQQFNDQLLNEKKEPPKQLSLF